MKIIQIHDPLVLKFPHVMSLFDRGLLGYPQWMVKQEVERLIKGHLVILGFEDIDPNGFSLIQLPSGFEKIPQVVHFHSEGSRRFTRALSAYTLDTVKKKGYNTLRAINGTSQSDAVWLRTFRQDGWTIKPKTTVFDFEVK